MWLVTRRLRDGSARLYLTPRNTWVFSIRIDTARRFDCCDEALEKVAGLAAACLDNGELYGITHA